VFLQDEFIRSSLFSVERLGWEASNPKLQSPEKFQAPNLNPPPLDGAPSLGPSFGA